MSKANLLEKLKIFSKADNKAGETVLPVESELSSGNYQAQREIYIKENYEHEVYHGSTHGDIIEFDAEKSHSDGDWGSAIYTSNSIDDINANYAGEGPDLTSRINRRAESISNELDDITVEEFTEKYKKIYPDLEVTDNIDKLTFDIARKELAGTTQGTIYPLRVNTKNYAVIGEGGTVYRGPSLDDKIDEARSEIDIEDFDTEEAYEDAIYDHAHELLDMDSDNVIMVLKDAIQNSTNIDEKQLSTIFENLDDAYYLGELDLTQLDKVIRDVTDFDGEITPGGMSSKILAELGYEGVIDKTVNSKFGTSSNWVRMTGVNENTEHIITFPGNEYNIRSQFAKFDPKNKDSKNILGYSTIPVQASLASLSAAGIALTSQEAEAGYVDNIVRLFRQGFDTERVLYHWTEFDGVDRKGFEQFVEGKNKFIPSKGGKLGPGVYLSADKNYGKKYVDMDSGNAYMMSLYVRGKLATVKEVDKAYDEAREIYLKTADVTPDGQKVIVMSDLKKLTNQLLQEKGFSGIDYTKQGNEILIFDPNDIRSVDPNGLNTSAKNLLNTVGKSSIVATALLEAEEAYGANIEQNIIEDQNQMVDTVLRKASGNEIPEEKIMDKFDDPNYTPLQQAYSNMSASNLEAFPAFLNAIKQTPSVISQTLVGGVTDAIVALNDTVNSTERFVAELLGFDYDKIALMSKKDAIAYKYLLGNLDKEDIEEIAQTPYKTEGLLETISDASKILQSAIGDPENPVEEIGRFSGQFLGSFVAWSKALKAVGWKDASKWKNMARNVTAETLAGMTMFDPFTDQFGELLVGLGVEDEFLTWITTKETEAEARFKTALDIALVGTAVEGSVLGIEKLMQTKFGRSVIMGMGSVYAASKGFRKQTEATKAKEFVDIEQQKHEILKQHTGDPNKPIYNQGANNIDEIDINFSRIETDEDVQKLIQQLADSDIEEISKARRGVQGWEQSSLQADKLNAWEVLKSRRVGEPLNAEQTIAVRRLWTLSGEKALTLAKEVQLNPSPMNMIAYKRQLVIHQTIQRQVLGARAETARALNAWRMPTNASETNVLLDQLNLEGNVETIAERHIALSQAGTVDQVEQFVNGSAWAKTADAVRSAWYFALLSGPKTHQRNFFGNSLTTMLRPFEIAVGARLPGGKYVQKGEATSTLYGMLNGMVRALRYSKENEKMGTVWRAIKTGESGLGLGKVDAPRIGGFDPEKLGVEPGTIQYYLAVFMNGLTQTPGRALTAADELFKTMNYDMEIHRLAFKEVDDLIQSGKLPETKRNEELYKLINEPKDYMRLLGKARAERQTFTEMPEKTKVYNSWSAFGDAPVIGKIIQPFQRTPYNIGLYQFERTPLAPLVKRYRDAINAGGAEREMAIAQQVVGTTLMLVAADLVMNGAITGGGPSGKEERKEWLLTHKPYSIRWQNPDTGQWEHVSYRGLEPVGGLVSMMSTMVEILQGVDEEDMSEEMFKTVYATTIAVASSMTSQTYMSGVSDFFEMLSDPHIEANKYLQRTISSFTIPAVVRDITYAQDPVIRHVNTMLDAIKARTPGLSKDLPARYDRFGREQSRRSTLGPVYDSISPFYRSTTKVLPIETEMVKQGYNFGYPQKKQNFQVSEYRPDLGSVEINLKDKYPHAYYRMIELAGQEIKKGQYGAPISYRGFISTGRNMTEELNDLVTGKHPSSSMYNMLTDGEDGGKVQMLRGIISIYRNEAKRRILEEYPEIKRDIKKRAG